MESKYNETNIQILILILSITLNQLAIQEQPHDFNNINIFVRLRS